LYPEDDYWQPISQLKPPENSTLTIIFVSSMHIYYLKPSYDPIFPAIDPYYAPGYHDPYYFNSDPRARALACVDTTELCSPNGKTCWSMTSHLPDGVPDTPAYWLMKWSLESSTSYDSIAWRLGTALLAQQKVGQSRSQPLSDNHWEAEAKRIFETSLARIQWDAWSIAGGEDRELPGYHEVTPDEGRGKLCKLYKFNSIGYTNIELGAFIGLLLVLPATWFLTREVEKIKNFFYPCFCCRKRTSGDDEAGEEEEEEEEWKPLLINFLLGWILYLIFLIPYGVYWCCAWVYNRYH
jgi:hypothetical protein